MPLRDEAEVRKALARRLRHEPDEAIWQQLRAEQLVQSVIDNLGATPFDDLVGEYRRFEGYERTKRRLAAEPARDTSAAERRRGLRLASLEELMAVEAGRQEGVIRFREQVLGGELLASADWDENAADWFLARALASQRLRGFIHASDYSPLRGEQVRPTLAETEAALAGYAAGIPQLPKYGPEDNDLDFLVCLVSCLMAWYGWPDSREVERFVFCGETPHVLFMIAAWRPGERFPGRSGRIALEVNQAVSPAELVSFYKDVKRLYVKREGVPRRSRACEPPAADLAVHVARLNDGRSWQEMMVLWNCAHPDSSFADSRTFARRARRAYETVTRETFLYRKRMAGREGPSSLRVRTQPRSRSVHADFEPT